MEVELAKEPNQMSIIDQIKEHKAKAQELSEQAKAIELEKANAAVTALNDLGFTYKLVEGTETKKSVNHAPSDKACSICGFKTNPPHDARSHRGTDPKSPFTDAQLAERKLVKVQ